VGHSLQLKCRNTIKISKQILRIIVNVSWYVNDTLHHDPNVPYVIDEIKRLSQRYDDRMKEHPNILATNLMKKVKTTRRLKRKLPQDRIVIYRAYASGHMLFKTSINCQMYY